MPDTTLLNGLVVSTSDNAASSSTSTRRAGHGVALQDPGRGAGRARGLSGTIDMQTARPLSFGERVIAVSGRYQKSSLGRAASVDPYGNRFSASYIDQFLDKTLGIAIGYAHSDMPIQENQVGLYEPWTTEHTDRATARAWVQAPISPMASRRCAAPATTSATA